MKTVIVFLLGLLVAAPAMAQAPVNGTYKSVDIGGLVQEGRYSEYWQGGAKLSTDNTVNEMSWDGATLGAQWWWYCPWQTMPATLLFDGVDGSGNGNKIWRLDYAGGTCWFDGAGPWGGGAPDYTATVDSWTAIVTETFSAFAEVGQTRTVSAQATFQGYNTTCMSLQVSNTEKYSDTTVGGSLPAMFPAFLDWTTCSSVAPTGPGEWGDVTALTVTIVDCETIPVEEKTWGAVKARYME